MAKLHFLSYQDILDRYPTDPCCYHTREHIETCMELMRRLAPVFRKEYGKDLDFYQLLTTILYHDIFYVPGGQYNEEKSANVYKDNAGDLFEEDIYEAILSTRVPIKEYSNPLQKAMHDIDWFGFTDYDTMVRNEGKLGYEAILRGVWKNLSYEDAVRKTMLFYISVQDRQIMVTSLLAKEDRQAKENLRRRIQEIKEWLSKQT